MVQLKRHLNILKGFFGVLCSDFASFPSLGAYGLVEMQHFQGPKKYAENGLVSVDTAEYLPQVSAEQSVAAESPCEAYLVGYAHEVGMTYRS